MNRNLLIAAALIAFSLCVSGGEPVEGLWMPKAKKLIDMSWSNPSVEYLKTNLEHMEKEAPVDGITIRVEGKRTIDGRAVPVWMSAAFSQVPWEYENFSESIQALKDMKFRKFTDNFLFAATYDADVDWFSDKCFEIIANHFAILARAARETGMKGIVLDTEEYGKKFWCQYPGHSHDEAVAIARKRGQQVGNAIFKNYPDAKVLCMFLFSHGTFEKGDAWASTLGHSFFNGIYDVLPPEATMIEGHEYFGYAAKSKAQFEKLRTDVDRTFMGRVAAKNIRKYRAQTQLAAPIYPDSYFYMDNPVTKLFLHPEIDNTPKLQFISQQFAWALDVSDEYVWIYSEKGCWWKNSSHPKAQKTWEEICPGLLNTINLLHNAQDFILDKAVNLLQIPPLDQEPGKWNFWRQKQDGCNGSWKDGIIWVEGAIHPACVNQTVDIRGGKTYLLRVKARPRTHVSGTVSLMVGFRNTKNAWLPEKKSAPLTVDTNGSWHTLSIVIKAPDNAGKLSFQLYGCNMKAKEVAEFKEPELLEKK